MQGFCYNVDSKFQMSSCFSLACFNCLSLGMIVDIKDTKNWNWVILYVQYVHPASSLVLHLYLIRTNGLFLGYMNHPGFSF